MKPERVQETKIRGPIPDPACRPAAPRKPRALFCLSVLSHAAIEPLPLCLLRDERRRLFPLPSGERCLDAFSLLLETPAAPGHATLLEVRGVSHSREEVLS